MAVIGRVMRNLTEELLQGATDGALKKHAPNWSNHDLFDETDSARRQLSSGAGMGGGYDWSAVDPDPRIYAAGYVRGA